MFSYYDDSGTKFCFNGFIFNEILGNPEPYNGDDDMYEVYGNGGRMIHDLLADINDGNSTFTEKKKLAIQFLEREGL